MYDWYKFSDNGFADRYYAGRSASRKDEDYDTYSLYVNGNELSNAFLYLGSAAAYFDLDEDSQMWAVSFSSSVGVVKSELGFKFSLELAKIRVGLLRKDADWLIAHEEVFNGCFKEFYLAWLEAIPRLVDLGMKQSVVFWVAGDKQDKSLLNPVMDACNANVYFNHRTPYPHEWYAHQASTKRIPDLMNEADSLERSLRVKYLK